MEVNGLNYENYLQYVLSIIQCNRDSRNVDVKCFQMSHLNAVSRNVQRFQISPNYLTGSIELEGRENMFERTDPLRATIPALRESL